jgi:hypothetical protein
VGVRIPRLQNVPVAELVTSGGLQPRRRPFESVPGLNYMGSVNKAVRYGSGL